MRIEKFEIGTEVFCGATPCGRLTLVTLERSTGTLAHLVVNPGRNSQPRLVPASWAQASADGIWLDCTPSGFKALPPAVVVHAGASRAASEIDEERRWRRHDEVSSWPVFGLGPNVPNPTIGTPARTPTPEPPAEVEDRVPPAEVRVHADDRVHAADGDVGRVAGVAVDAGDRRISHVLLDEGHLWGRKRVAVPVRLVRRIDDEGVTVRLSKRQVKGLPPVGEG